MNTIDNVMEDNLWTLWIHMMLKKEYNRLMDMRLVKVKLFRGYLVGHIISQK